MTLAAFSSILIGNGYEGALLLVLFSFSEALEESVTLKAKSVISSLKKLSPTKACVVTADGSLLERSIKDVSVGTSILVKAGQVVPLDGIVMHGTSAVNLAHLTGENIPVTKKEGDEVVAGALNLEGALTLQVIRTNVESTLAKIVHLITQAQSAKPRLQNFFDKISGRYSLSIILLALLCGLTLPLLVSIPYLGIDGSIYRVLAFLIAASPCALIIALPIAYLSAISACAKKGILLKGGAVLDTLARCTTMAFDKTGTLTYGALQCTEMYPFLPTDAEALNLALTAAAALERNCSHPIAHAIMNLAKEKNIVVPLLETFKTVPGYGLEGTLDAKKIYIGNSDYIFPHLPETTVQQLNEHLKNVEMQEKIYSLLLIQNQLFIFIFQDHLRAHAAHTIQALTDGMFYENCSFNR